MDRWPGCYIPCLPEKKTVGVDTKNTNPLEWKVSGNEDAVFLEERRILLERFLRELAKSEYIIGSTEFRLFARGLGEIDKQLTSLPKQTPMGILEKYRLNFKIDEDQDVSEITRYRDKINNFSNFIRKALVQVERQRQDVKVYVDQHYE